MLTHQRHQIPVSIGLLKIQASRGMSAALLSTHEVWTSKRPLETGQYMSFFIVALFGKIARLRCRSVGQGVKDRSLTVAARFGVFGFEADRYRWGGAAQ